MTRDVEASARKPRTPRRAWRIGGASLFAAVLTWVLTAVAARFLGPAGYADFMVVWGFIMFEIGLLRGLQQEVTRAVAAARRHTVDNPGASAIQFAALVGTAGSGVLLVSAPAWGSRLFGSEWVSIVLATAGAFLFYALYNSINGALAGATQWTDYAVSMATESLLRLVLLGLVLVGGGGRGHQSWGLAGAGLTWLILLPLPAFRGAVRARGDSALPALATGTAHAMVATGCSALLISGFPVLLKATASAPLGPDAGVIMAAVVATRAPLLLPLNGLSALILTHFTLAPHRMRHTLRLVVGTVGLLTVLGASAAYVVGPWLLRLLFGSSFVIEPGLMALLVVAAGLLNVQTVSGSAVLALGRHKVYSVGWVLATVGALLILSIPFDVGTRTVLALILGPIVGIGVNAFSIARQSVSGEAHANS